MRRIGLISDTHGLLRPAAVEFLRGCEHIIHAGDIGDRALLDALGALAPVTAVRGNNDLDGELAELPETVRLQVGSLQLYVLHDLKRLAIAPAALGVHVVISGTRTVRWWRSARACSTSTRAAPGGGASSCRSAWANWSSTGAS